MAVEDRVAELNPKQQVDGSLRCLLLLFVDSCENIGKLSSVR